MKRITITVCIVSILFIGILFCSEEINGDELQNVLESRPDDLASPMAMRAWEWQDIDHIMEYTTAVIRGKVHNIKKDTYDNHGYMMDIDIDEVLWGKCPYEQIIFFDDMVAEHIEDNGEYLIFMYALDSFAFPENSYVSTAEESFYTYRNGMLYGTSKKADGWLFENNDTLDEMREYLVKYPTPYSANTNTVANSYDEVSTMYEASDSVAKVKIMSVFEENDNVELINIDVIDNYKGEAISREYTYIWPKGLETGEEYFVFVDADGLPVAREGAIIGANDSNFNEAKEFLANK